MLPTFVIGLREGLEAALIVGIIAAFLRKQGRKDLLGWVMGGVVIAIALCVGAGFALQAYSRDLPQKQQEGLETIIGALAVGMVTYMVIWMRRNSRNLKGQLEDLAADAIGGRSNAARAMVLMAFLAVIREGVETVVFVLAAFNEAANGPTAGIGLLLGIGLAIVLGYGIYRGGVHLNLSKFFRATGIVLVFVAAGIVVNALHTAHEAGWIQGGQSRTVNLSWLVDPGSVRESLLTGMLGLQAHPVTIEAVGWLVYLIPVGLYVAWPPGRRVPHGKAAIGSGVFAGLAAVGALLAVLLAPSAPQQRPTTTAASGVSNISAVVIDRSAGAVQVRVTSQQPVAGTSGPSGEYRLATRGLAEHAGRTSAVYRGAVPGSGTAKRPRTLQPGQIAERNGNRLPIGIASTDGPVPVTYADATTVTVWLDTNTDRVLDIRWNESITGTLKARSGAVVPLDEPVAMATVALPRSTRSAEIADAQRDQDTRNARSSLHTGATWLLTVAIIAALAAIAFALLALRRRRTVPVGDAAPAPLLIKVRT